MSIKRNKSILLGVGFTFLFVLLTSGKMVFVAHLVQGISPICLVFYSFIITTLIFNLVLYFKKEKRITIKGQEKNIILLNVWTCLGWIGFFYALKYIEPAIVSSAVTALGPLFVIIFNYFLKEKSRFLLSDWLTGTGILLTVIFLTTTTLAGQSGVALWHFDAIGLGLIACLTSGVMNVLSTIFSKRLNEAGWSPSQLMAHRFYILIVVSVGFVLHENSSFIPLTDYWLEIILIVGIGVSIPLFFLQSGIEKSDPKTVSAVIAIAPVVTLLLQFFDSRIHFSFYSLGGVILITSFVFLNIFLRELSNKKAQMLSFS